MSRILQKLTHTEAMRKYYGEHKDEFLLVNDDTLEELHKCYLSMLKDIDSFFERNGIQYCLTGGSTLGKVRHNGFIPWDDDIDLAIPRDSYEKLKLIYDVGEDPFCEKYDFRGPGYSKGAIVRVAKLLKNDSILRSVVRKRNSPDKIFIDLFVIDYVPDSEFMKYVRGSLSLLIIAITSCVESKQNGGESLDFDLGFSWKVQRFFRNVFGTVFSIVPLQKWYACLDSVTMNTRKNIPSKRITLPTGRIFYFSEMLPTEVYYPFRRTDFCGVRTWLPNNPEKYLDNRYGNWHVIPDPNDRESHYVRELRVGKIDEVFP